MAKFHYKAALSRKLGSVAGNLKQGTARSGRYERNTSGHGLPTRFAIAVLLCIAVSSACSSTDTSDDPASDDSEPPAEDSEDVISDTEAFQSEYRIIYTAEHGFVPSRLDVPTGEPVVFVNESDNFVWPASNIHPTHEVLPSFDPQQVIKPGEAWAYRFKENGYWRYHNHIEPSEKGMVVSFGTFDEKMEPLTLTMENVVFPDPPATASQDYDLYNSEDDLNAFVKEYGPSATVGLIKQIELATPGANCHDLAHDVGRIAFKEFGPITFALELHECQSGALHGSIEALFAERGTATLAQDVAVVCSQANNAFVLHQCLHGIGHGVMAWTSYEIHDALQLCNALPTSSDKSSCNSGIFMENVVGGLSGQMGHTTEYLDSSDPHYPCDVVAEQYVPDCYFYQTSHMKIVFNYDYEKVAQACSEAPLRAQTQCYGSYGRDVGAATRGDPATAIKYCEYVADGQHRVECIRGAVQDRFWEKTGADEAITFCTLLEEASIGQDGCYHEITFRALYVFTTPDEREAFCAKLDDSRQQSCRDTMASSA